MCLHFSKRDAILTMAGTQVSCKTETIKANKNSTKTHMDRAPPLPPSAQKPPASKSGGPPPPPPGGKPIGSLLDARWIAHLILIAKRKPLLSSDPDHISVIFAILRPFTLLVEA